MRLRPIDNPPNPFISEHREWLEPPPTARLTVYEEHAKSILSHNESPDLPYDWSVNPYRGCQHGCIYCYARCSHEYLGFGSGTDFETRLVAKVNAPELLDKALRRRSWTHEPLHFSGVTDAYQPLEAVYQLTRRCLEVCLAHRNPVCVVTKGALVLRDVELLAELHAAAGVGVCISIPAADDELIRLLDPQAAAVSRRFEIIRRLSEAGVPVGVMLAPVIPGLTESEIPQVLTRAAAAGAATATISALRLPGTVQQVFAERVHAVMPLRAKRILDRTHEIRGGNVDERRFGHRLRGQGSYWNFIVDLFRKHQARLQLNGTIFPRAGRGCGLGICDDAECAAARPSPEPSRPEPPTARDDAQLHFGFAND